MSRRWRAWLRPARWSRLGWSVERGCGLPVRLAEIGPGSLPLAPGSEPPVLPGMEEQERHLADLWAVSASTAHPIQFVRERAEDSRMYHGCRAPGAQKDQEGCPSRGSGDPSAAAGDGERRQVLQSRG